jgi:hypothetical protein
MKKRVPGQSTRAYEIVAREPAVAPIAWSSYRTGTGTSLTHVLFLFSQAIAPKTRTEKRVVWPLSKPKPVGFTHSLPPSVQLLFFRKRKENLVDHQRERQGKSVRLFLGGGGWLWGQSTTRISP